MHSDISIGQKAAHVKPELEAEVRASEIQASELLCGPSAAAVGTVRPIALPCLQLQMLSAGCSY